jgi:quinol monooxygenase YgiN
MRQPLVNLALMVRLEAKPGKGEEVVQFLAAALAKVEEEDATVAWFAVQFGPRSFGIFDAFPDEIGREAHLNGKVAAALMERAPDLFESPPAIEKLDVLASKLPF